MGKVMIILSCQIACDTCGDIFNTTPVEDSIENDWHADRGLLHAAEKEGWKVNRFAHDVYYGIAQCPPCTGGINE